MAKQAQQESTIPMPVVIALVLVMMGLAGGLTSRHDTEHRGRRGTFEVTFEWHLISGGVSHNILRNATHITNPPTRATGRTGQKTYRFPGYENDQVTAIMLALRPFDAQAESSMFVSIIFHPEGGMPTLPVFSRDITPGPHGVKATYR